MHPRDENRSPTCHLPTCPIRMCITRVRKPFRNFDSTIVQAAHSQLRKLADGLLGGERLLPPLSEKISKLLS